MNTGTSIFGKPILGSNQVQQNSSQTITDVQNKLQAPEVNQVVTNSVNESITSDDSGGNGTPILDTTRNETKEYEKYGGSQEIGKAIKSFSNNYSLLHYHKVNNLNDIKHSNMFPKYKNGQENGTGGRYPTIESLITDFDPKTSITKPYRAVDFMFCKDYPDVKLNRIFTLRRYLFPTYDNLEFEKEIRPEHAPIAQAVGFFGEGTDNKLSELLKFSGSIKWGTLTADVWDIDGNEQGFDSTPFVGGLGTAAGLFSNAAQGGGDTRGDAARQRAYEREYLNAENYTDYTGKTLGPVNVINETRIRERPISGGLEKIELKFSYELRSYNGINPRLILTDLICNMLALSFNNARFWGGMNRYFPAVNQFQFLGNQNDFYSGNYSKYFNDVFDKVGTGFSKGLDVIQNIFSGLLKGDLSALTNTLKGGASTILDLKTAKSRPKILGFRALLSGAPVGEYHLAIGNPYRPIVMMGNLICTGFSFELNDELGMDDFPTGFTFTVNLEQGRPRDKGDLESLLNGGNGRIYVPPKGIVDISNSSASTTSDPKNPTQPDLRKAANQMNKADSDIPSFAKKLVGSIY